jgi:hypothetical protein
VSPDALLQRAEELAETLLFPSALAVDTADRIPDGHLAALAQAGLYGAAAPADAGGAGFDRLSFWRVVEALASGCLATTFTWIQHQGLVRRLADAPAELRDAWLPPLCAGTVRGGIALGGCLPGPPALRARRTDAGWRLDGHSPWVTGWGAVDVLLVAARTDEDTLVWGLTEAQAGPSLTIDRQQMVAVNASGTVDAHFSGHALADERVTGIQPFSEFQEQDGGSLATNGFLALGGARRCLRLVGPGPLDDELARCRSALEVATPETLPAARAHCSALAVRAATALVVTTGSRSVLTDQHAQRLAREAVFTLVFGSRPTIKRELLAHVAGSSDGTDGDAAPGASSGDRCERRPV